MIVQWDRPAQLETPAGTLMLNYTDSTTGRRFQLNPEKCDASLPVRVTDDDVPQGDGKIPHRRWRSGYGLHLAIEPLIAPIGADPLLVDAYGEAQPACDQDLVEMTDLLGLHINAMIRTGLVSGFPNARYIWTPSGFPDRMLDRCQLSGTPTRNLDGALGGTQIEFDLDTPYPYYMSYAEHQYFIGETGAELINNAGNTSFYMVAQVFGPFSNFILLNDSIVDLDGNPLEIVYDAGLPGAEAIGGTDYLEINFFTGQAFLNGNEANRVAGIDFRYSDFFELVPGDNLIACVGALALLLINDSWA